MSVVGIWEAITQKDGALVSGIGVLIRETKRTSLILLSSANSEGGWLSVSPTRTAGNTVLCLQATQSMVGWHITPKRQRYLVERSKRNKKKQRRDNVKRSDRNGIVLTLVFGALRDSWC